MPLGRYLGITVVIYGLLCETCVLKWAVKSNEAKFLKGVIHHTSLSCFCDAMNFCLSDYLSTAQDINPRMVTQGSRAKKLIPKEGC
jgi:hypothetical protein